MYTVFSITQMSFGQELYSRAFFENSLIKFFKLLLIPNLMHTHKEWHTCDSLFFHLKTMQTSVRMEKEFTTSTILWLLVLQRCCYLGTGFKSFSKCHPISLRSSRQTQRVSTLPTWTTNTLIITSRIFFLWLSWTRQHKTKTITIRNNNRQEREEHCKYQL